MRIVVSEHAGACFGVERALRLAEEAIGVGPCTSLGALIHNPRAVSELASRGLATAESLDEVETTRLVIRSHGVLPSVRREAMVRGFDLVDATCPFVARAQRMAEELAREARTVIVVGRKGHPEVESLRAYAEEAGGFAVVAESPDELPDDLAEPIGVVVQTTQTSEALNAILCELGARALSYELRDTICEATRLRQDAASDLAGKVDAMVVLGGHNSANTNHLAEICAARCPKTLHVERAEELDTSYFDGCETIGITAGASTPESQIEELRSALEALG